MTRATLGSLSPSPRVKNPESLIPAALANATIPNPIFEGFGWDTSPAVPLPLPLYQI
jgi:hypothetical protein